MKLGLCTTDLERTSPENLLTRVADYGFSCVQLAFDSVEIEGFTADTRIEIPGSVPSGILIRLDKTAASRGLDITAVNGTFNMSHPDSEIRSEGVRRFPGFLDAAKELGARYISICTGSRNPAHLWRPHPDNITESAWCDMQDTVLRCTELAASRGLTLMVEVEASNVVNTPERAKKLLDAVGDTVKIVLDPANLFKAGEAHPENVRRVLDHADDVLHDDVVLAHGKDILEGEGLKFCGAGYGIVDFDYMLRKISNVEAIMLHGAFTDEAIRSGFAYLSEIVSGLN